VGDEIFRTHPDRPSGPTSILFDEYWVIPRVKRPDRVVNHPPQSIAEVKERVELYIYSPSAFMACYKVKFTFHIHVVCVNYFRLSVYDQVSTIKLSDLHEIRYINYQKAIRYA